MKALFAQSAAALQIIGWVLLAISLFGALHTVLAAELVRRRLATRDPEPERWPTVTLLRPLYGAHVGLEQDLESVLAQDYPAPIQLLIGLQDASDPAYAVADALRRRHHLRDIRLVVDARLHGLNRKVSNLINLVPHIRREVVVISDSDIRVPPDYLRRVVSALAAPGVGGATCLYVGRPEGRGLWSRLSALGTDQHFLPLVVFGKTLGLAEPCLGSTIALTGETLERIGGLQPFADTLADDYEIGRAVRSLGLKLALPSVVVEHAAAEQDVRTLLAHELRWARTIRRVDPLGYAGSGVTNPLPLALIGALAAWRTPLLGAGVVATVLCARLYLALRVAAATRHRPAPLGLTPVRDILTFITYLASFGGDSVTWGGERFRTDSRGAMRRRAR